MPYSPRVKSLAYKLDPECWISYSGKAVSDKRDLDARRCAALDDAQRIVDKSPFKDHSMPTATIPVYDVQNAMYALCAIKGVAAGRKILDPYNTSKVTALHPHDYADVLAACRVALAEPAPKRKTTMTPLKIKMMLHFATVLGPFTPEPMRTSPAYTMYVKELLHDGMIERPTHEQRETFTGWAYKATPRGQCYVKALTNMPLPVRTDPVWAMPV